MEESNQQVYVIDLYNKYSKDDIVSVFSINGRWWCIKKVTLEWGKPRLSSIEDTENEFLSFHLYNTLEEAQAYVREIKRLEGAHF